MFWSMSFQLLPGEAIIDSSDEKADGKNSRIQPSYSVFLTNKRMVFRLDSLRSSMVQSFTYEEILEADTCKRVFINYLRLRTKPKVYFVHVGDPGHWCERILKLKRKFEIENAGQAKTGKVKSGGGENPEKLLAMLKILEDNGIMSREEYEAKVAVVRERTEAV